MKKNSILLLNVALFVIGCSSVNTFDLVERWYTKNDNKQRLTKEIFWKDFDKKIKLKEIEYNYVSESTFTQVDIYEDSLLHKSYMIDDLEGIDTFNIIEYYYDHYHNVKRYTHKPEDLIVSVDCELTLDSVTFKPVTKVCNSSDGNSFIIENEYFKDRKVSRTFIKDTLVNYVATYYDKNNNEIARYREFLSPQLSISDSIFYEYDSGKLKKVLKYSQDTLSAYKDYLYQDDKLVKIELEYLNKGQSTIEIKYSAN